MDVEVTKHKTMIHGPKEHSKRLLEAIAFGDKHGRITTS